MIVFRLKGQDWQRAGNWRVYYSNGGRSKYLNKKTALNCLKRSPYDILYVAKERGLFKRKVYKHG